MLVCVRRDLSPKGKYDVRRQADDVLFSGMCPVEGHL